MKLLISSFVYLFFHIVAVLYTLLWVLSARVYSICVINNKEMF